MPAKKQKNDKERSVSINLGNQKDHSVAFEEKVQEERVVEIKPQIEKLNAVDPNQPINK